MEGGEKRKGEGSSSLAQFRRGPSYGGHWVQPGDGRDVSDGAKCTRSSTRFYGFSPEEKKPQSLVESAAEQASLD